MTDRSNEPRHDKRPLHETLSPGQEVRSPDPIIADRSTPWLQTAREGLKVCGECNGRGSLGRRRCHACIGTGKYSYDSQGNRVAWRGGVGWCRT